jgi:flagellar M-ring protein FliF
MIDTQEFGKNSGARQVILIGLAVVLISVVLLTLWFFVIRTQMEPAFTGLKSTDASMIIEELKRQKTPYEIADNGATIKVPEGEVDAARIDILGSDLPLKGTVGFELFNKTDMGLTDFAQKINYQRALQGELARTLMSLDIIETARVHLSLPEAEIFQDEKRLPKASVTLTPKLGRRVDAPSILGVQRMVASAVADLEPDNVVVLDSTGQLLSQDVGLTLSSSDEGLQMGATQQFYAAKIRESIAPVISNAAMRITVWMPPEANLPLMKDDQTNSKLEQERSFPIRISIAVPGVPDIQLKQKLIPYLTQSVGYDTLRGDSLSVLSLPNITTPAASVVLNTQNRSSTGTSNASQIGWGDQSGLLNNTWWPIALGGAVVILMLLLWPVLKRRQEMTFEKREAFSSRLKQLLDQQKIAGHDTI